MFRTRGLPFALFGKSSARRKVIADKMRQDLSFRDLSRLPSSSARWHKASTLEKWSSIFHIFYFELSKISSELRGSGSGMLKSYECSRYKCK